MPGPLPSPQVKTPEAIQRTARGLIVETNRPEVATTQSAPNTQQAIGGLVGLAAGQVVTSVAVAVTTAGSGTAPTLIKLALVDKSGNVLAATANVTSDTKWTSTGVKSFALSAPFTITATDGYYLMILINGTFASTNVQIARYNSVGGVEKALSGGARTIASGGTGLTDLTGTLTLADVTGASFWFGAA